MQLGEAEIGLWVMYQPAHCKDLNLPGEKGRIKSWNDRFIFVVYHCAGQWDKFMSYTAAATAPEDLVILEPELTVLERRS